MNDREPKYDILIQMAKYFNVSVDYLLGVTRFKSSECQVEIEKSANRTCKCNNLQK